MDITSTFTGLKEALETYLHADATAERIKRIEARHEELAPSQPVVIESEKALNDYLMAVYIHGRHMLKIEELKTRYLSERSYAYTSLVKSVPISNSWFKIQVEQHTWAVGTCYDSWGGGHMALSLKPWNDDLGSLNDRTYYP